MGNGNKRRRRRLLIVNTLMYTPRALFSRLFFRICWCILSLSLYRRSASYPPLRNKCPIFFNSHVRSHGKVWSVYIHEVNRIVSCTDIAVLILFFKMAVSRHFGFQRTRNIAVPTARSTSPKTHQTRSGSDDALLRYGHLKFSKM